MKSVAIVGAGLRGLASAAYLKSVGLRVHVFEQRPALGGVWSFVNDEARINTPHWGYTFHATNRWMSYRPTRVEIQANLLRLVEAEGLDPFISLGTPVRSVEKTGAGRWRLNGDAQEEFDGVLVCPGFLGERIQPAPELVRRFEGEILFPYAFQPERLAGKRVTVVGSGASAMDVFAWARQQGCPRATVIVHPGTPVREVAGGGYVKGLIKGNPFIYGLTKKKGDRSAAVCSDLAAILATPGMQILEGHVSEVGPHSVTTREGHSVDTDVLVWCAGWNSPTPSWVQDHRGDPTMVLAACASCLDTAGFGYGTASAHAKGLHAALTYGLKEQFKSGTADCDCDQEMATGSRHIVFNLILYYLRQPGGWRALRENLVYGARSNVDRLKRAHEPLWSKLAAFFNAPLGF